MRFDDASRALVELAASRHNAFHSSEAADMPHHRLRRGRERGELTLLGPRVWAVTALGRPPGQALRAATLSTADAAAIHRGSGWLHGWYDRPPPVSDIWVPGGGRSAVQGVRIHRAHGVCSRRDVMEVNGIRTLTPAATLCLLGRAESDAEVERCLDAYLLEHPESRLLDTLNRLWVANGAGPVALARVLSHPARLPGRAESPMERLAARLLANADLPPIELQHEVVVGGRHYRIDLAMPSIRLGIECHSRRFHWGRSRSEADNERDLELGTVGWELRYVTWAQLQDPDRFVAQVAQIAALRRQLLGQP